MKNFYDYLAVTLFCLLFFLAGFFAGERWGINDFYFNNGWHSGYTAGETRILLDYYMGDMEKYESTREKFRKNQVIKPSL